MYSSHKYDSSFTAKVLSRYTESALRCPDERSVEAVNSLEGERLAKATCDVIVNSALDGKTECVVDWIVPKVSLQTLGYSVVRVVRDRPEWVRIKVEAAVAQQSLEDAFDVFEKGRYEWGGLSGSYIDHRATIDDFARRAQHGYDFSSVQAREMVMSHLLRNLQVSVSSSKFHLFGPLQLALANFIPPLALLKKTAFRYRGLGEELDKGTRISWTDSEPGLAFSSEWPTALEAAWLARYWYRVSSHVRWATEEVARKGMYSTLYGIADLGPALKFYKPITIAQEASDAALQAESQSDEEENTGCDDEYEVDEVDEYHHNAIRPLENMFRPISIALRHCGFSVTGIDAATVDGLLPPLKPVKSVKSAPLSAVEIASESENADGEELIEPSQKPEPKIWLFEIGWRPSEDFEVKERDVDNYRFHIQAELAEPQVEYAGEALGKRVW